ncbi:MAG: hypothetical protein PHU34_09445 [Candidatus Methanoperedens sp.]|nr:hypothetical protein [Candidatus Methanoperedens sp.]
MDIIAYLDWQHAVSKDRLYDDDYWKDYDNKGVYALLRRSNGKLVVSYIGISQSVVLRMRIHDNEKPTSKFKVADVTIKNGNLTRNRLELIEHILIYTMQPPMNKNKRFAPPNGNIRIYNEGAKSAFPRIINVKNGELL